MVKELLAPQQLLPVGASLGSSPCTSGQKTPRSFHPSEHLAAPSLPPFQPRSALSITYVSTHKYLSLQGNSSSCLPPLGWQGGNAVCPLSGWDASAWEPSRLVVFLGFFFGQAAGCGVKKDGMNPSPVISGRLWRGINRQPD